MLIMEAVKRPMEDKVALGSQLEVLKDLGAKTTQACWDFADRGRVLPKLWNVISKYKPE